MTTEDLKEILKRRGALYVIDGHRFYTEVSVLAAMSEAAEGKRGDIPLARAKIKTLKDCQKEVAIKYGLGKSLVTGHRVAYFDEAPELYAQQFKDAMQKQKLKASE